MEKDESSWYLSIDGKTSGPFDTTEIQRMLRSKTISWSALVCTKEMKSWIPIANAKTLTEGINEELPELPDEMVIEDNKRFADQDYPFEIGEPDNKEEGILVPDVPVNIDIEDLPFLKTLPLKTRKPKRKFAMLKGSVSLFGFLFGILKHIFIISIKYTLIIGIILGVVFGALYFWGYLEERRTEIKGPLVSVDLPNVDISLNVPISTPIPIFTPTPVPKPGTRTVVFPLNRCVGYLKISAPGKTARQGGFKDLGDAIGVVEVPLGYWLCLFATDKGSLDFLEDLNPNDIQVLCILYDIPSDDLRYVSHLTGLEVLRMRGNKITNDVFQYLLPLKSLVKFSISSARITDAGMGQFVKFRKVNEIDIKECKLIGNNGILRLKTMKQLIMVHAQGTRVTSYGKNKLQKELPRCKIYID